MKRNDNVVAPIPKNAPLPTLDKFPSVDKVINDEQLKNAVGPIDIILLGTVFGGLSFIIRVDNRPIPSNTLVEIICNVECKRNDNVCIPDPLNGAFPILIISPSVEKYVNALHPLNAPT
jgi:hypothetical protein